jgi:hypothetical protein
MLTGRLSPGMANEITEGVAASQAAEAVAEALLHHDVMRKCVGDGFQHGNHLSKDELCSIPFSPAYVRYVLEISKP